MLTEKTNNTRWLEKQGENFLGNFVFHVFPKNEKHIFSGAAQARIFAYHILTGYDI